MHKKADLNITQKEKIKNALLAVFPTTDAYLSFVENETNSIEQFVQIAAANDLIKDKSEKAFEAFLQDNSRQPEDCVPPEDLTFTGFLKNKHAINMSTRALTISINRLIKEYDLGELVPSGKVSNAMFSRLGHESINTNIKRNTVRLLSFWLGYHRPELGLAWNYESLLRIRRPEQNVCPTEGVRIGFCLSSRGALVGDKAMKWLKRMVHICVNELGLSKDLRICPFHTTCFYVDLPREKVKGSNLQHPAFFSQSARNSIAIAHQISVKWALSEFSSGRILLTIGIIAGTFSAMEGYMQSILHEKLPQDPMIRMTDYTRLCILVNDIRIIFSEKPYEITMSNGESINTWWLAGFWSTLYWEFDFTIMKDELLRTDPVSTMKRRQLIQTPHAYEKKAKGQNLLEKFFNTPQNSQLGIEIAKVLFFRRCFWDAIDILKVTLSIDHANLNARTLKLMIFCQLGVEASSYNASCKLFYRAEEEANFIESMSVAMDEDFYCEHGILLLGKAMKTFEHIRRNKDENRYANDDVFNLLNKAIKKFQEGLSISPTGHRSIYWLLCVCSFKRMLEQSPEYFEKPHKRILDHTGVTRKTAKELFISFGWLEDGAPYTKKHYHSLLQKALNAASAYDQATMLRTYRPNIKLAFAILLWDFSPAITVGLAEQVIKWLYESIQLAGDLIQDDLGIYSIARLMGTVDAPEQFIVSVQKTLDLIEESVGTLSDLKNRDKNELLEYPKVKELKIFSIHIGDRQL